MSNGDKKKTKCIQDKLYQLVCNMGQAYCMFSGHNSNLEMSTKNILQKNPITRSKSNSADNNDNCFTGMISLAFDCLKVKFLEGSHLKVEVERIC